MTPATLRDGLADALKTLTGLTVSMYRPSAIQPPHAVLSFGTTQFDNTMGRGSDTTEVRVVFYAARTQDEDAERVLDQFTASHGTKSIKAALENTALTGLSSAMVVVRSVDRGPASSPDGQEFLAASFDVTAVYSGTT